MFKYTFQESSNFCDPEIPYAETQTPVSNRPGITRVFPVAVIAQPVLVAVIYFYTQNAEFVF